jgi:hypothetical protein
VIVGVGNIWDAGDSAMEILHDIRRAKKLGHGYSQAEHAIQHGVFEEAGHPLTSAQMQSRIETLRLETATVTLNRALSADEAAAIRTMSSKENGHEFEHRLEKAGMSDVERNLLMKVFAEDLDASGLLGIFNRSA